LDNWKIGRHENSSPEPAITSGLLEMPGKAGSRFLRWWPMKALNLSAGISPAATAPSSTAAAPREAGRPCAQLF